MKKFLLAILMFSVSFAFSEGTWREYSIRGFNFLNHAQYQDAAREFNSAVDLLSDAEEEILWNFAKSKFYPNLELETRPPNKEECSQHYKSLTDQQRQEIFKRCEYHIRSGYFI